MKGLLVDVLRHADGTDCTAGGASSRYTKFVLTDSGMPEIFEPGETAPRMVLAESEYGWRAYPAELVVFNEDGTPVEHDRRGVQTKKWAAFGGNFITTCDSRFVQIIGADVVKVFDRVEG
jgi:hypothetical protein